MEKLIIAGYVGMDAEVKEFNGKKYTSFSIAVDKSYKRQDGTKVEKTNWYSVLRAGENIAPYIKKGTFLIVVGEPRPKPYKDRNGEIQQSLNINAQEITFGGSRGGNSPAPQPQHTPSAQMPQADSVVHDMTAHQEEDFDTLPF